MDLPSQFERLLSRGCSVNLETLSGQDNTHQLKIVGYIVNDQDRSASQLKLIEARPQLVKLFGLPRPASPSCCMKIPVKLFQK